MKSSRFSLAANTWLEFRKNRMAVAALLVLATVLVLSLAAPWIAPQDPYDVAKLNVAEARQAPGFVGTEGFTYWLGSDDQGRDLLSAILYGVRISLQMGILSSGIALLLGALLGAMAGFQGGHMESAIMRVVDLQLSFPAILMALILAAMLGQGRWQLMTALVTAQYAYYARTAYGAATAERGKEYVTAALSTPLSATRVLLRHVLPNCLAPLIVIAPLQAASAISLEATLSFLGLGLPVTEPSLGMLIANGFRYMLSGRYWISIYPGVAIIVVVIAINLVGDQIREQMNPRLKR